MSVKLLFVASNKGGVGKTTMMVHLTKWYQANDIQPFLIDADEESATLRRHFPTATCVELRRQKALDLVMNLIESGKEQLILLDVKAGAGWDVLQWFSDVPWEELSNLDVKMVCVGVLTSSPDSVSGFLRYPQALGHQVEYLIVRNLKDSDTFGQKPGDVAIPAFDATKQALEFRRLFHPKSITLPALDPEYASELERVSLTISDVLERHPKTPLALNSLIVRSRLRNYRSALFEQFMEHRDLLLP